MSTMNHARRAARRTAPAPRPVARPSCPDCGEPLIDLSPGPVCVNCTGWAPTASTPPAPPPRPRDQLDDHPFWSQYAGEDPAHRRTVLVRLLLQTACIDSAANRELLDICRQAEDVAERARAFAEEHGEGCDCGFRRYMTADPRMDDLGAILSDLRGLAWSAQTAVGPIRSNLIDPVDWKR